MTSGTLLANGAWWITLCLLHVTWLVTLIAASGLVATALCRRLSPMVRYRILTAHLFAIGLAIPLVVLTVIKTTEVGIDPVAERSERESDPIQVASRSFDAAEPISSSDKTIGSINSTNVVEENHSTIQASSATAATNPATNEGESIRRSIDESPTSTSATNFLTRLRHVSPYVSIAYFVGLLIVGMRMFLGVGKSIRLQNSCDPITDPKWHERFSLQARQLGLSVVPRVALCHRVVSPVVIGFFRPMILIPPSIMTGLSPAELESVLAHELGHIRRMDHQILIIQRVIESLLFFHPAVWILAKRIHRERELCCDQFVLKSGVDQMTYVSSLVRVAEIVLGNSSHKGRSPQLAVDGGRPSRLRERIEHILEVEQKSVVRVSRASVLGGLILVLAFMVSGGAIVAYEVNRDRSERDVVVDDRSSSRLFVEGDLTPQRSGASFEWTTEDGRWELLRGVLLTVETVDIDEQNKRSTASLYFPASDDHPRTVHQIHVRNDQEGTAEEWAMGWSLERNVIWLLSMTPHENAPYLRRFDYSNPEAILVHTELGIGGEDEQFTPSDPDDPFRWTRQRHFSIGSPMQPAPDAVIDRFKELLPDYQGRWQGPYSPLSGNYEVTAITMDRFRIQGRVVDSNGDPIPDANVTAKLARFPTIVQAESRTDRMGDYELTFPVDLTTFDEFRGVELFVDCDGMIERNLYQSGEFTMVLELGESVDRRFSDQDLLLGMSARADFQMEQATILEGVVVDELGNPLADRWVNVRVPGQRQGYSIDSATTDQNGEFRLSHVPPNRDVELGVTTRPLEEASMSIQTGGGGETSAVRLEFSKQSGAWRVRDVNDSNNAAVDTGDANDASGVSDGAQPIDDATIANATANAVTEETVEEDSGQASVAQDGPPPVLVVDDLGNPIEDALVELKPYAVGDEPTFAQTTTDQNGRFRYPEETPDSGYFYLQVSKSGYVTNRWIGNYRIRVRREGEWVADELSLDRSVTVKGVVLGPDARPLAGVPLAFDYFNENVAVINQRFFESDEMGRFELIDCPRGELFVRYSRSLDADGVVPGDAKLFIAHVHVRDQREVEVTLDLARSNCTLEGRFENAQGEGVADAEIRISYAFSSNRLDHSVVEQTDENGVFRMEGLPPDAFVASASVGHLRRVGDAVTFQLRPDETSKIRMKSFSEGNAPPAERTEVPNWGERFGGLQSAIVIESDQETYGIGDVIQVRVLVWNPTDDVLEFDDTWGFNRLHFTDEDGNYQSFDYRRFSGIPVARDYRLQPGQEVLLAGSFSVELSSGRDTGGGQAMFRANVKPGNRIDVRVSHGDGFDGGQGIDETSRKLISGRHTIEIVEDE